MAKKTPSGNDRRLKWGDGWVEERPRQDGSSRWIARWREPTPAGPGPKRSRTFSNQPDAEEHVRAVADEIASGTYVEPDKMTVDQLVTQWIDRGVHEWKASTVATYRQRHASMIVPHLGSVLVSALTPPRVQFWVDTMVKLKVSPNTIDATVRVLSGAYHDAVRLGVVSTNPVTGTRKPTIRQAPVAVWSADEAKRVIAHVADDPMWNAVYRLHLATGVRPGELQVIRWKDIDLVNAVVTISRTMTKDGDGHPVIGDTTKTGRARAIALASSVVNALSDWRKRQLAIRLAADDWQNLDLVFTTEHGRVITQRHWQGHLTKTIAATGVTTITPHGIRHTAATLMLERGVHPKIVSDILGHANIQTTLDLYSHVSPDLQRTAISRLAVDLFDDENATTRRA